MSYPEKKLAKAGWRKELENIPAPPEPEPAPEPAAAPTPDHAGAGKAAKVNKALAILSAVSMLLLIGVCTGWCCHVRHLLQPPPPLTEAEKAELGGQLLKAVENAEIDKVCSLVERGADVNAKGDNYWTPLLMAARKGYAGTAKFLLEHGADISTHGDYDRSPLHMAALSGSTETVKILLEHGADPDVCGHGGYSPLHYASGETSGTAADFIRKWMEKNTPKTVW